MAIIVISPKLRAADGGDGANDIRLYADFGVARLSSQFAEVISSSHDNTLRLTTQSIEVISSGHDNVARLSSQFIEVLSTFGTPPIVGPGNSNGNPHGKPPGQEKKDIKSKAHLSYIRARVLERQSHQGQFIGGPGVFGPTSHVAPPLPGAPISRPQVRIIHRS